MHIQNVPKCQTATRPAGKAKQAKLSDVTRGKIPKFTLFPQVSPLESCDYQLMDDRCDTSNSTTLDLQCKILCHCSYVFAPTQKKLQVRDALPKILPNTGKKPPARPPSPGVPGPQPPTWEKFLQHCEPRSTQCF